MASKPLQVAVIGVGGIARTHNPGWVTLQNEGKAELAAFCDVSEDIVQAQAKALGVERTYTDYRKLLRAEKIDVVDVCTPNAFHCPITCAALKAGCHVICEKPMAPTAREAKRMAQTARDTGLNLMIAQHMRWMESAKSLKTLCDAGDLGDVYYVRAQALRRRFVPARASFYTKAISGGGPMIDIGVHILDLAYWLMGCPEPVTVSGMAECKLGKRKDIKGLWGEWDRDNFEVEDFAVGLVRFANGAMLTLETSWLANMREKERMAIQLFGTEGGATYPENQLYTEKHRVLLDVDVEKPDQKERPHHQELRAFTEAVLAGKPSPIPPEQSVNVVRMLTGVYRSQDSGKEVRV